jgi:uncharacterized protein (DUF58 family)
MKNSRSSLHDDRVSIQLSTLIHLAKKSTNLRLGHHRIHALHSGNYLSPFKGRGMEFDETRVYQPGDDIRSIDWRVTARSNQTHTKIYREEKERPVFISVDYRPTMEFATRGTFKSVQAAKLAALLAWAAQHQGDRIGGQVFNEHGCKEFKPKNGRHAVLSFLNALVNPVLAATGTIQLTQILARLAHHARPGSLIYIISDFRGLNSQAEHYLAKLVRHCEVILIHVYDPMESQLPEKGLYRFTDGKRDITVNTRNKQLVHDYQHQFQNRLHTLQKLCKKWRVTLLQCCTTDDPIAVLS